MTFRERLREQIDYCGFLDKEVASMAGISKRTIDSYVGSESCMPSAEVAVRIARVLGVTVEYLVTGQSNLQSHSTDWKKQEINNIINKLTEKQLASFLEISRAYQNSHS